MQELITPNLKIRSISFSRLETFNKCPKWAMLAYIQKLPVNDKPDTDKEPANERGSRIHDAIEQFIKGKTEYFPEEAKGFEKEIRKAKKLYKKKKAITEELWAFDKNWNYIDAKLHPFHPKIWLRIIIDLFIWESDIKAKVIDFKTGKRDYNEVKHGQQLQLYALCSFLKYPNLKSIIVELWYLDLNKTHSIKFTRKKTLNMYHSLWNNKLAKVTNTESFIGRPNSNSCRFCPYRTGDNKWINGTNDCDLNPE